MEFDNMSREELIVKLKEYEVEIAELRNFKKEFSCSVCKTGIRTTDYQYHLCFQCETSTCGDCGSEISSGSFGLINWICDDCLICEKCQKQLTVNINFDSDTRCENCNNFLCYTCKENDTYCVNCP